ncbi:hypothetical protein ACOMHN_047334 [Nucella lapillus]
MLMDRIRWRQNEAAIEKLEDADGCLGVVLVILTDGCAMGLHQPPSSSSQPALPITSFTSVFIAADGLA